ncbi:MAG: HAMP domain-containing histidine kinase [Clostridia bacterium]|nr:HAMP domain-containing histidine kinase [Clostridia bacterium]
MPDKTIPIPTVGNADEGSQREHLAAYFITAAPYEEQTTAQRIEYCQKLRELGELENREVLQAAGSSRVLVWGNPASHLQHLLTATQYLAAGLGYPLLLFPAKDTIINFHTLLHPRLLSLAAVNLLRAACAAAPKEPIWVRLQEQASCLTVTVTTAAPIDDAQALAVAKECARLHGGSLAQSDNIVGFSCARMSTPPRDVHHYRCSTAEELLRDTLSPVWTGFYGWLFPSSPSSNTSNGSSDGS